MSCPSSEGGTGPCGEETQSLRWGDREGSRPMGHVDKDQGQFWEDGTSGSQVSPGRQGGAQGQGLSRERQELVF